MAIRIDAEAPTPGIDPKTSGRARYAADILSTQALHAAFLLSTQRHARIKSIDTSAALAIPGVVAVITGADIGDHRVGRRVRDYPVLAVEKVLFAGQRVAAVAAWDADTARRAADLVDVEYEPLDVVATTDDALRPGAPVLHPDYDTYVNAVPDRPHPNIQGRKDVVKGRGSDAFADAEEVYEDVFTWSRSHAAPLEPHACLVVAGATEVHVHSAHKEPYKLRRDMALLSGLPEEAVVVHPVTIGGDFGAKGMPYVEGACYFLSKLTGRPVRTAMTYFEELTSTGARHGGSTRLRTGLRDGVPYAHEHVTVFDGGAFVGAKPQPTSVISAVGIPSHAYHPPHRSERAETVYTNNLPGSQVRAPGEFQITFAGESHFDMIARARGEDPLEFRLRCAASPEARKVLEALRAPVAAWRSEQTDGTGIGVAVFHRGAGSGDTTVVCKATDTGVELLVATPDQGAGSYVVFQRLAAQTLGIDADRVAVRRSGTSPSLKDAGAGGSRVTVIAGGACVNACKALLDKIGAPDGDEGGYWIGDRLRTLGLETVEVNGTRTQARGVPHDVGPTHGAVAVEVAVDRETGIVRVRRCHLVIDAGRVINEVGHRGQLEGGFVYGLGQTLFEDLIIEDGQVVTASLGDYKLASAADVPALEIVLLPPDDDDDEQLRPVGELANLGVAPAVANAVHDAVGVRVMSVPITAEKVWQGLRELR